MRVVFMGTPEISVAALRAIVDAGHDVVAAYAQPPRRAGRGQKTVPSPVHLAAQELDIPVFTPDNFKLDEDRAQFASLEADVAVVFAYGLLLPQAILDAPKFGCLNIHASDLPRWRGAAPIQRALMAGDRSTAVCIMQMEKGLDTGPVGLRHQIELDADLTAGQLHDQMRDAGADLIVKALDMLATGKLEFVAQSDEGVTYAKKIVKSEARIDFSIDAERVHNHIRGLSPFPGAWFEIELAGKPVRIKALSSQIAAGDGVPGEILDDALTIACRTGTVKLLKVQRAGKGMMSADEFLRGTGSLKGQKIV